ncbi:MAG TPA: hypothetical protein VJ227_03635 [Patescibacteria group bacterium]|nr:hypothetical protein [Patescibacteria group bacterium]
MKQFAKDLPHYMLLGGILLAGFAGLVLFSYDIKFQAAVAIATAVSYTTWGIVHHYIHRDLHPEVIVEYAAVSLLGLVILFSLILR